MALCSASAASFHCASSFLCTCSALARAGKSVLLLDSTESYGASWATLSGSDFVHTLINRQLQRQQQQHSEQQQPQQQEPEGPQKQQQQLPGAVRIALQQLEQLHGVHGCSLFTHPQVEEALADKGLLIDLAPKVSRHNHTCTVRKAGEKAAGQLVPGRQLARWSISVAGLPAKRV